MMLNNFIGGGQIFLHKIRMLRQVFSGSVTTAIIIGTVISIVAHSSSLARLDFDAIISFRKAMFLESSGDILKLLRKDDNIYIDVKTQNGIYASSINVKKVLNIPLLKKEDKKLQIILQDIFYMFIMIFVSSFMVIFVIWAKFGHFVKSEKKIRGGEMLTSTKVKSILKRLNLASHLNIGDMPLVKDSETKHFLVCGSTGSGKTNLIHNILKQVNNNNNPAMVIDTTGEMIAKYYNPARGDIIFNPLDARGTNWDFWKDCCFSYGSSSYDDIPDRLKKFSAILFHFKRSQGVINSDPFWDQAAEKLFNSIVTTLASYHNPSYKELYYMTNTAEIKELRALLGSTPAMRYLSDDGKGVASSVAAVLSTSSAPLSYLRDDEENFSLIEYFNGVAAGKKAWIFFSSPAHQRELLMPLIACLTELATSLLMEQGPNHQRRFWVVIDELASLGNLPAIDTLMSEGRKYGACVVAGLQSINQLYKNYGQFAGSTIFGQFATKFFFRTDEPVIAKMISNMCGIQILHQQKQNISFGANEFRDGQSYTEHQQRKHLVEYSDIASLKVGECFVLLPVPEVRLSKITVPISKVKSINKEFIVKAAKNIAYHKEENKQESKDDMNNNTIMAVATNEKIVEPKEPENTNIEVLNCKSKALI